MEDNDLAIARLVDIELDEIDPEPERPSERREAVLRPEPGSTPVRGDRGSAGSGKKKKKKGEKGAGRGRKRDAHDPDHGRNSTNSSTNPRR